MLKFKVTKATCRLQGEDKVIYFKTVAPVEPVMLEQVIDEISEVCTLTRADIKGGLVAMQMAVLEALAEWFFGTLGRFGLLPSYAFGQECPID